MQQFIPFEDDWDALEKLSPEVLVPYRVGFVAAHDADIRASAGIAAPVAGVEPNAAR